MNRLAMAIAALAATAFSTQSLAQGDVLLPADPKVGEFYARVLVPDSYETYTKTVHSTMYRTGRYQKLVSPAQQMREVAPAKFSTVSKTRRIKEGRLEWRSVRCETNAGIVVMTDLQRGLARAGYNPGPIDGVIGRETMAALVRFQEARNLVSGKITMEVLKALGVDGN